MKTNPWYNRIQRLVVQTVTLIVVTTLLYADVSHLPLIGPLFEATAPAPAEAAELPAIRVESFDQDVAADGTTFVLDNDVGDVTSAFIKLNSGTRKTSGGPTGSTANTAPDVGTAGLVLTDTTEVTVERLSSTPVKVMGEVWRYEGPAGGAHEFIVRDRLEVSLTGSTVSNFVTGVDDVDRVVPFVTGYTVNGSAVGDWEAATIAAHMDDSGNLVVSRNNSAAAATVYVDVVEFTGSAWTVCHGYSNAHDTAPQTITLNTDADGQGGATCDVGDWGAATIIEATMEGDSGETGLSDTLALVRPGATTDTIEFDIQQDTNARNDGQAWIHVLQNDDLVVNRAANADIVEGNGTYGSVLWPSGASTEADLDLLSLEWFTDTSGVGTAHMRGGLNARITQVAPIIYNDNDLVPSTDYDSTVEGNFRSTLTFAASPEGVVYEAGGTGTGAFVGYNDVGEFIVRAGSGASGAPADAARLVITPSEYDFAGRSGILRWNFYQSTNAVDLSFDEDGNGSIDYATSTTAAAAWANWSGGDDGGVGTSNGSLAGSEITSAFDFNGTITEVRFTQGGGGGYEIQHWIHRSGNNVGVDYGVVDLTNLTFDSIFQNFDTIVVATGTQAVSTDVPTNNLYVGGAFVIREKFTSRNVTGVIIAESGTVDASTGLDNIRLLYEFDTSAPYDCASESYDGSELQYGLTDTDGFSAADGTVSFTDSVSISPTQSLCLYPLLDVTTSATDGQTIELAITNPSTDVAVSGGAALGPGTLTALNGTTLLQSPDLTQVHYHWREDDGSETAASSVTGAEDTPVGGFQPGTQRRLRIAVSAEGSATADPVQFRLQFAEKAGTCEAATGWEDVAAEGGAWDIGDSPNLAFADATTNILNAAQGAVSDEELVFTGTSAVVDTGDKSLDITLADDAFTELEYTVISTAAASQGTTYCFRVVDEAPDDTHAYRIPVTIQASQVASSLSDFPVYVDLSLLGGHFFSNVASDGSDIRVTTDDGRTEIAREVVSIDTGSGTGELHFNAPSISDSANTTFYVYYGAAGEQELQASSTYGAQQVWNDNYVAVYHYDDTPSGSNSILDSTANANHGTSQGGLSGSNLTTGRLSQGYNFSGGNYYIDFPQLVGGNSQMTVSYWINNPSYNDGRAFSSGGSGLSQVLVWPDDAGGLECIIDGTRVGNSANPTGWVHHACTYDGATIRNYANSVPEGTGSKTGTIATIGSGDRFGVDGGLSAYLQDTVDELRIKSTPVSGDWLAAEYTNQTNPATFFATSSFETLTNDPVPISFSVYPEATITADVSVAAAGAATASVAVGTNDVYLGGTYSFVRDGANRTLTSITVRETRTIDAALLSNPRLFYELDTSVPYDCVSESYDGTEPSVSGTAFSGANGSTTFTLSQTLNSTQTLCGYMVVDIDTAVPDGATIALEIANPNSDVVVTSASVGPSSPVAPTGSTTVNGPVLTQTAYHWRLDDGTEADASSATAGLSDTPLENVPRESIRRVRVQVDNAGSVASQPVNYRLEYGVRVTTCENISSWNTVDEPSAAWVMATTSTISDGNTTDIAPAIGGIANPAGATFVGTGALRESSSDSGAITLSSTQFTELEYAIASTELAGFDTTYCFRVTDASSALPSYSTYPELTTLPQQDFVVQRGAEMLNTTSVTLTAGADYTAPINASSAFVRITNSHHTGVGGPAGSPAPPEDTSAYIEVTDLTSSFDIVRPGSATGETYVAWEIVEYIGVPGGDNEMVVRDVGTVTYGANALFATGTIVATAVDDADVAVFITGQRNPGPNTGDTNLGLSLSSWNASVSVPVFERGDADGVAVDVSYAVVEFTGANWAVQRAEHTYTAAGVFETQAISPVTAVTQTFLHTQKLSGDELFNLDETGHEVLLSGMGTVSFELQGGAATPGQHRSVAWVIENMQTGTGALRNYRSNGTISTGGGDNTTFSLSIGDSIQPSNASIFINNQSTGSGAAHPRAYLGATIASSTNYELYRSDDGQNQDYRVSVIEWPVAEISLRQNYYRLYVDNDTLQPTDPWPAGGPDLGENESMTDLDQPMGIGERVRIRMSILVNNATLVPNTRLFTLQYGRRDTSCSAVSTWNDVGAPGSGEIWRGLDGSPVDGATVASSTLLLSVSDQPGTYEEESDSALNPSLVDIGEDIEYDWILENNGALQSTSYCFRMVEAGGGLLDGYDFYPTVRTSGYTPVITNWRWYDDIANVTPTNPVAGERVAATNIDLGNTLKLRVGVSEIEGAPGENIKFNLEYSEYSDFRDGGTLLTATSSCSGAQLWCYADGGGVDNAFIPSTTLTGTDSCVAGIGDGCGVHNEVAGLSSPFDHSALATAEHEFTLRHDAARVNQVYYFRLVDATNGVPLAASGTFPSIVTAGSNFTLTIDGLPAGTSTEGVLTDVASTPEQIRFPDIPVNTEQEVAHRVSVSTNATGGYRVFLRASQPLTSGSGQVIPGIAASNTSPGSWSVLCPTGSSCFGYHAGDDSLSGDGTRFALDDTYAALPVGQFDEIMYNPLPENDTEYIIYRVQINLLQPAGAYSTTMEYIAVPSF